jgi:glyoxylase-like metal-dependent hydrolase (beta-lactamase superfamily II)
LKISFSSFTLHIIEGYMSSLYLVEYDDSMLLLDSGCINDIKRIEDYCNQVFNRPPGDIKLAVVSHMHPDHAGGAATLRSKYDIPIAAHKDVDLWYSKLGGSLQHKLDCYMAMGVARSNKRKWERMLYKPIINPDFLLNDLQSLPFFDDWTVLHTPGHTLHDIILYHQQESLLYIGDLICDVKGKMLLPLPVMFPTLMENSYNKLAALNPSTILMAHGGVKQTENASSLFLSMKEQLSQPPNSLMRRVYRLSGFSPEIKRQGI